MIGNIFSKWTVLSEVKVVQNRKSIFKHYLCRCECGTEKVIRGDTLRSGRSSRCKDCSKKLNHIDTDIMIGTKIGSWEILSNVKSDGKCNLILCRCKCGKEQVKPASVLKNGRSKQCHLCNVTKHGYEKTITYNTWRCMRARCNSPKNHNYKNYGARGIKVCERWGKFENFLEDMGERPEKMQLDRKNNDGNYEKENCHWVTPKENSSNRRKRPVLWNKK
jgi:hypothetical protein